MIEDWLKSIESYISEDGPSYLYVGTEKKPRSTIVKVNLSAIDPPKRVPIVNKSVLNKKHETYLKITKKNLANYSDEIKIIFSIIYRKNYLTKAKLNKFSQPICDWVYLVNDELAPQIELLLFILGRACRNSRQRALTQLVSLKSPILNKLLYLLSKLNEELEISIFRELARWKIRVDEIITLATNHQEDKNKDITLRKYSFLYLLAINEDIENSEFNTKMKFEYAKIKNLSPSSICNEIFRLMTFPDMKIIEDTFLGLYTIAKNDPNKFERIILQFKNHLDNLKFSNKIILQLRKIMSYLIKYVEVEEMPNITGFLLLCTSIKYSYDIEKNGSTVKITKLNNKIDFNMKYIRKRILNLFTIWEKSGRPNLIINSFKFYIENYITEEINNLELYEPNLYSEWININPYFSSFQKYFESAIKSEIDLTKSIKNLIYFKSQFLFDIILDKFDSEKIFEILSGFTLEELFHFYSKNYIFSDKLDFEKIIKDLNSNIIRISDIEYDYNLLLNFAVDFELFLENIPLRKLLDKVLMKKGIDSTKFKEYMDVLTKCGDANIINLSLATIVEFVELHLGNNLKNPFLLYLSSLLIRWDRIAKIKTPLNLAYKVDSFKIIMKDILNLQNEDTLDSFNPISVETIVTTYEILDGEIHSFIEASIQYSLSRPNTDQQARHYLALGLRRPKREALMKSQLVRIPKNLTTDVLGQISLVSETIKYCQKNGFNRPMENLIISNVYRRGWNIDRNIQNQIASLLGVVSPRLRSYFASYLVLEIGDITNTVLKYACNVDNYQLRISLLRSLERFGSTDMWLILTESIYEDIASEAIKKLRSSRISDIERNSIIARMISSDSKLVRKQGINWLSQIENFGENKEKIVSIKFNHDDILSDYLQIIIKNYQKLTLEEKLIVLKEVYRLLWRPILIQSICEDCLNFIIMMMKNEDKGIVKEIKTNITHLFTLNINSRNNQLIEVLSFSRG